MAQFLGSALDIPPAVAPTHAVRKEYVDSADVALADRIGVLESGGGAGGSGLNFSVRPVTADVTAFVGDFILADTTGGTIHITLPDNPTVNSCLGIKKIGDSQNHVIAAGQSGALVDGDPDLILLQPLAASVLIYDGTNWHVESTAIFDTGEGDFLYRGDWATGVDYFVNDVVFYTGGSYIAKENNNSTPPTVGATDDIWGQMAAQGVPGPPGSAAGGVPTGGTAGQLLSKIDATDFNTTWTDPPTGGTAGLINQGVYAPATTYQPQDVVQYNASSYVATATTTGNLPTDTNFWAVFASEGPAGPDGADGPPGPEGPPGSSASAYEYTYSVNTAPPPASGQLRTNAAPAAASTVFYMSYDMATGATLAPLLWNITAGDELTLQGKTDATSSATFEATADAIDHSAEKYVEVPVALVSQRGTVSTNQRVLVFHAMHGEAGPAGAAATIAAGTATGLPAGQQPTVTNSGTSSAAVFNFGIPAGADGAPGVKGDPGTPGAAGPGVATGGTAGQILSKVDNTNYNTTWINPPTGSGGSGGLKTIAKNTNYTALPGDLVVTNASSGPITITLPTAPPIDTMVGVKKSDSSANTVTVVPGGTDKIDNDTAVVLAVSSASVTVQYDGTQWRILSTGQLNLANNAAGIPSGGAAGQILTKNTTTNYDASWLDATPGIASGGTTGQALVKSSNANYATTWQTLVPPAGGVGQVLTKTGPGDYVAAWQTPASGGGLTPTTVYTSAPPSTSAGQLVLCNASSGGFTVTLPASPASGATVGVKKVDTSGNAVTVVGAGVTTIDGDATCGIVSPEAAATFVFDGTNWQIQNTAIVSSGTDTIQQLYTPNYRTGYWYDRRSAGGMNSVGTGLTPSTIGTYPIAVSSITYVPQFMHRAVTIDSVGIVIGTTAPTAGCTVRIGLYANTASNTPGARSYDFGAVSPTTAISTAYTLSVSAQIPRGWSWWALSWNATNCGSMWGVSGNQVPYPAYGTTSLSNAFAQGYLSTPWYYESGTGILNATAASTPASTATTQTATPNVFFRVA